MILRIWRAANRLYQYLLPLRFSFLAVIAVAFAFLESAQGYDIIANLAEDDPTGAEPSHDGQRIGFIAGVILLALQTWYWSRRMLHVRPPEGRPGAADYPRLNTWLPRILGASVFAVAIAAIVRVARNYGVAQPVSELTTMAVVLAIALLAFIAFAILRRKAIADSPRRGRSTRWIIAANVVAAIGMFVWCTFFVQSTVVAGAAAVLLGALILCVPVGSALVWLGTRAGVPVLTLLLLWAVAISPLADNHVVETRPFDVKTRPAIGEGFDRWFERLDRQHPTPDGSHPVIVVATEGGGIRAAYWTAAVLTSLTDTIPTFADHTFAISAVSGGALGSTVYEALLIRRGAIAAQLDDYKPQMNEHGTLRFAARQMLSQDSLAPTLAAMTQPDLAQRFLPAPILPDRARALEEGWERAWRTAVERRDGRTDDTFAGGFLAMMRAREDRFPSLFLNGTMVETGQRIVASNLRVESDAYVMAGAVDLFGAIGGDVRVSTAVANSTRFTYVSPAGTLRRGNDGNGGSPLQCEPGQRCEHVVDGGYFDNSGAATLTDVLEVMARSRYASRVRPHVIFIHFRKANPAEPETVQFANEAFSPVRAMLAVRGAHASLAAEELQEQMGPANFTVFELVQRDAVFPLGWLLSDRTRNLMDQQMGPNSSENGANVRRIAAVLGQPVGRDLVQELAARGERAPRFQE